MAHGVIPYSLLTCDHAWHHAWQQHVSSNNGCRMLLCANVCHSLQCGDCTVMAAWIVVVGRLHLAIRGTV
jgi:hypothetical protein